MLFRLGDLPEPTLRAECRTLFAGEPSRAYWARYSDRWPTASPGDADRFVRIIDDEFETVIRSGGK